MFFHKPLFKYSFNCFSDSMFKKSLIFLNTIRLGCFSLIGLKFYSKEENLNLLSTTDLINLLNNFDTIQYEVRYINLLGFKSNCIIFGKIINSAE